MGDSKPLETKKNFFVQGDPHLSVQKKAKRAGGSDIDHAAIARADKALEALSANFGDWMRDECDSLLQKWSVLQQDGVNIDRLQALFRVAHDIKGEAPTLGYPLIAEAADSLSRLIEYLCEGNTEAPTPLALIRQHVETIDLMQRDNIRSGTENPISKQVIKELHRACDHFISANPPPSPDE